MWLIVCFLAWRLVSGVTARHGDGLFLTDPLARDACSVPLTSGKLNPSITDPWSPQPRCKKWRPKSSTRSNLPVKTHCLFSQSTFRYNHGLSLVTTSEVVSDLLSFGVLDLRDECTLQASSPPQDFTPGPISDPETGIPAYEVWTLPGKGKGVIALRSIKKGEVFMLDYPAILAASELVEATWTKTQKSLMEAALNHLPEDTKNGVLNLAQSGRVPDMPLADIFATNTCSVTLAGGVPHLGLFIEVSRMNHACIPNAFFRFNSHKLVMEVVAFRDIEPGEEVNINYTPMAMPYKLRQEYLETYYGFSCSCSLCKAPESERKLSDENRMKVAELLENMNTAKKQDDWVGAEGYASQALEKLSEAEVLTPLAPYFHGHLAKIHLQMGNVGRAKSYGVKAVDGFSHLGGVQSESAQELRELLRTLERRKPESRST